jgi:hypothetical protein
VTTLRILLAAGMIVGTGIANAGGTSNDLAVAIAFIGTSNGEGVYTTNALSISIGGGEGDFAVGAWANGIAVATAVGSEGAVIQGPQNSSAYEANVCFSIEDCN